VSAEPEAEDQNSGIAEAVEEPGVERELEAGPEADATRPDAAPGETDQAAMDRDSAEGGSPAEEQVIESLQPDRQGDWLAVSITGYAVRVRLRAGADVLVHDWLRPGYRDTFYSYEPFWADTIVTHGNAISLTLNGEPVRLPRTTGNVITNFRISPGARAE
jgi:hypothetical protein